MMGMMKMKPSESESAHEAEDCSGVCKGVLTLPLDQVISRDEQVVPFVANLLPEGDDLRGRLEWLLHVDRKDDFGLLEAIGRESAGALSFWPEGQSPRDNEQRYTRLNLDDFQLWREFAHQQPFVLKGQTIRMSLAGAQAKTALYFDAEDKPYLPENGAPTSHILKPNIHGCLPGTVFTEYLSMKLAREVLGEDEVPEVDVWQNCYRIRRYDRPRNHGDLRRFTRRISAWHWAAYPPESMSRSNDPKAAGDLLRFAGPIG